eukprot:TRINITY_DN2856_c0_g1_i1.p1 TRINITY_DN2856_c0_g1~~TRINITY_DN2856_c0_g1_i1.p1  ORF type:complete len:287 (-),score=47.44 TRINITY_DN2856_c0_g1_i1:40-864(-)
MSTHTATTRGEFHYTSLSELRDNNEGLHDRFTLGGSDDDHLAVVLLRDPDSAPERQRRRLSVLLLTCCGIREGDEVTDKFGRLFCWISSSMIICWSVGLFNGFINLPFFWIYGDLNDSDSSPVASFAFIFSVAFLVLEMIIALQCFGCLFLSLCVDLADPDKVDLFLEYLECRNSRARIVFDHLPDGDKFLVIAGSIYSPVFSSSALAMFFLNLGLFFCKAFGQVVVGQSQVVLLWRINACVAFALISWSTAILAQSYKVLVEQRTYFGNVGLI